MAQVGTAGKVYPHTATLLSKDQKRILVTGGAGFVGSHLVDALMMQVSHGGASATRRRLASDVAGRCVSRFRPVVYFKFPVVSQTSAGSRGSTAIRVCCSSAFAVAKRNSGGVMSCKGRRVTTGHRARCMCHH